MRSENIYADSDTYAEIIQSCIVLQDGSAIRQFVDTPIQMKFDQRIQKAQHMTSKEIEQEFKSNGLSLRVYNDLIHGFAKLGDTRAMERTFLKHTQIQQTLKSLHKEYNDIFSWSLKGASIGMYASMVYCYGVRFDSNSLRKCVGELFDSIILERVWEHEILKIERVKQDKLKELDKEIEEIEGNDQFVGVKYVKYRADKIKGVKKRATHLDTESYSIKYNDEFIKVPFIVGDHIGVNGPFKSIYASFIEGWTRALELMKDEPKVHVEGEFGIEIDIGMPRLKEYFSTHRYKKLEKSDVLAKMEQLLDDIRAVEHDAVNSLLIQRYRTKCIEE